MPLEHLTEEQIRTWTREQKDRWWFEKVYRGDMPQLTLRSGLTGFFLGGLLSATNLYVGAKTGWTLGVGLTSVILAFAMFKILSRAGARDMTILENNAMQSVATAAGYMTGPLISGMAAYMWIENKVMPWHQMLWFNVVLSVLGVLVAFPMKRRFINDEQQPFPEGRACGVVLDTLYSSAAAVGMFKAKVLAVSAGLAGGFSVLAGENIMRLVQEKWAGLKAVRALPTHLDGWYYMLVEKGWAPLPKLAGVDIRQLELRPSLDLAMIGAGGLLGIKPAINMLLGMFLNFVIIVPWMIARGEIKPKAGSFATGDAVFTRAHVVNTWALWWGVVIMVVASLVALFARPQVFVTAFRVFFSRRKGGAGSDVLGHIELPLWVSWVGVPIVGAVGVWLAWDWFDVKPIHGALAILLIMALTMIAAGSTAMTSITPTGALSKIPQFIFGAANPHHPPTNLMTAVMCTEVASNASNLLMDIKPGYMLGAKPRQQAIAHCIGILSGALASTPLFFLLFLSKREAGVSVQDSMVSSQFGFPAAQQWQGVSKLITTIFGGAEGGVLITNSILWSMIVAGAVGVVFEVARIATKYRFPLNPLAIGLGVVIPPESNIAMFMGAAFFWLMHRLYGRRPESGGNRLWVQTQEPICAGLIAGAALVGIADILIGVFVF
jgi:uncharacterized oligopeptide transporter (OPT) family protein